MRYINGLSIRPGSGGIELGLHLALGEQYRTMLYCEREAFNASILVARMEDKTLCKASIWDDISTLGKSCNLSFRVDLVSVGPPPLGAEAGDGGDFSGAVLGIIRDKQPGLVFGESTQANLYGEFQTFAAGLEEMGYRISAGIYSPHEIGAPHLRWRLFYLARGSGIDFRIRRRGNLLERLRSRNVEDTKPLGLENAEAQGQTKPWPTSPTDMVSNNRSGAQEYVPEPCLQREADGTAFRVDRLQTLGYATVPVLAAHAFCDLSRILGVLTRR